MSRHQEGELMNFTRGSEIWLYQIHMLLIGLFNAAVFGVAAFAVIFSAYCYFKMDKDEFSNTVSYYQAKTFSAVGMDNGTINISKNGKTYSVLTKDVPMRIEKYAMHGTVVMKNGAILGGLFGGAITIFVLVYWWQFGRGQMADERLRGAEKVEKNTLVKMILQDDNASPYQLMGVPMVKGTEPLNIAFTGAQGVGKSQNFHSLMRQVRARNKKGIVYDPTGAFTSEFYREGKDILLNPFDKRSPAWNVWNEIRNPMHYETIANGLIPSPSNNENPFFAEGGRMVLKTVFKILEAEGKMTNQQLYDSIVANDFHGVHALVQGSPAEKFINPKTEKTSINLLMTLQNKLECFEYLSDEGQSFSIRDFMMADDDRWLFIRTSEEAKDVLKPILSLWINTIIKTTLSLPETSGAEEKDKIWLFVDELPTLQKLDDLAFSLTNTRKYGLCHVLGFQDFNQIYKLYGEYDAKTILSGCQTKFLMRVTDDASADIMARALGEVEMDEKEISRSMGVHSARDGVSFYGRRNIRKIVLGSEIQSLDNLEGYLTLAGKYPITKIKFDFEPVPQNVPVWIPNDKFLLNKNQIANSNKNAALSTWNTITNVVNTQTSNMPAAQANTNTANATNLVLTDAKNSPAVQSNQTNTVITPQAPITSLSQNNAVVAPIATVSDQTPTESAPMAEQLNASNKPTDTGSLFNFDLSLERLSEEDENKIKSNNV